MEEYEAGKNPSPPPVSERPDPPPAPPLPPGMLSVEEVYQKLKDIDEKLFGINLKIDKIIENSYDTNLRKYYNGEYR